MRRFDWRRFEPQHARDRDREELDLDQAHWPPVVGENLLERYHSPDERRQTINGLEAWDHFVRRLLAEPDVFPPPQELTHRRLTIVDEFFAAVANPFPKPPIPCVFVSHQRLDTHRGERVACLVDDHGLDFLAGCPRPDADAGQCVSELAVAFDPDRLNRRDSRCPSGPGVPARAARHPTPPRRRTDWPAVGIDQKRYCGLTRKCSCFCRLRHQNMV